MPAKTSAPAYSYARSAKARDDITTTLRRFGCESVGIMDDYATGEVLLAFTHRGRPVQFKASAKGWAQMYLKANPYNGYRRCTRQEYEQRAVEQGLQAVNSILRDWVKGQVTRAAFCLTRRCSCRS
jgi:hypothetical protein